MARKENRYRVAAVCCECGMAKLLQRAIMQLVGGAHLHVCGPGWRQYEYDEFTWKR